MVISESPRRGPMGCSPVRELVERAITESLGRARLLTTPVGMETAHSKVHLTTQLRPWLKTVFDLNLRIPERSKNQMILSSGALQFSERVLMVSWN